MQQSVHTGEIHLIFIGSNLSLPNPHIVQEVLYWSSQSVCNVDESCFRRRPLDIDVLSTILQCTDISWWVWYCAGVREMEGKGNDLVVVQVL